MEHISAKEITEMCNVSLRRMQKLCDGEHIIDAKCLVAGKAWLIRENTVKPADRRVRRKIK